LANYGPCTIDINDGSRELEVIGGDSLLIALRKEGLYLASACGGRGTCAFCKAKILEGGGPVGPTEEPLLSAQEIAEQVRITCQVKVRNDMRIAVPEALLNVREFRGRVEKIEDLTHDIKLLRIKLLEPQQIRFVPGQYIQLEAPPYGKSKETVFRAYSIASPPEDEGYIELMIRLVPEGICTTWVFEHLKEGDEVTFTGPFGEFRLSDTELEMIWIAGGSGMAPFWSILRHLERQGAGRPTTYFFGAVTERDLFLVEELEAYAEKLPWFRFVSALSGEVSDAYQGERGLITDVVGRHLEGNPAEREGYLCGSPGMIDASIRVLNEHGIPDERVYYDKFA
ncbi:MAG: 2Fe-2S iron-sulfur cluster binding domain-containing protein, partial [Candidatus Eisenbacteria bacterium]|nr:2Fe-2S iron-sulfur cluster binding domain-containing protein [Candidatus Eisenbacteria bacterium]